MAPFSSQKHVLCNGEREQERALLSYGPDPHVDRIFRVAKRYRLPLDEDLAGVRSIHSREHFREGRFSRPVVPNQPVDLSGDHRITPADRLDRVGMTVDTGHEDLIAGEPVRLDRLRDIPLPFHPC